MFWGFLCTLSHCSDANTGGQRAFRRFGGCFKKLRINFLQILLQSLFFWLFWTMFWGDRHFAFFSQKTDFDSLIRFHMPSLANFVDNMKNPGGPCIWKHFVHPFLWWMSFAKRAQIRICANSQVLTIFDVFGPNLVFCFFRPKNRFLLYESILLARAT